MLSALKYFSASPPHSVVFYSFPLKDSLNTVSLPAQKCHEEDLRSLRLGFTGLCPWFFPLIKLILTGHCSLVANSLPDFPLPVKLAHNHKWDDVRVSISTVKSWRIALLGQKWDDITLMDFTVAAA